MTHTITLEKRGFEHAKQLIRAQHIAEHGWAEFGKWHLAEGDEISEYNKSRYKFSFADFKAVHRCAVLAAELRAGQYKYTKVELAAAHLHGMLDELIPDSAAREHRRVSPY